MNFPCKMYSCNSAGEIEVVTMLSFGIVGDASMPTFTGLGKDGKKFLTSSGMYHPTINEAIAEAVETCLSDLSDFEQQIVDLQECIINSKSELANLVAMAGKVAASSI